MPNSSHFCISKIAGHEVEAEPYTQDFRNPVRKTSTFWVFHPRTRVAAAHCASNPYTSAGYAQKLGACSNETRHFRTMKRQHPSKGCPEVARKEKPPTSPQVRGLNGAASRYSHSMASVLPSRHSSYTQFSASTRNACRRMTRCRVSSASGTKVGTTSKNFFQTQGFEFLFLSQGARRAAFGGSISPKTPVLKLNRL